MDSDVAFYFLIRTGSAAEGGRGERGAWGVRRGCVARSRRGAARRGVGVGGRGRHGGQGLHARHRSYGKRVRREVGGECRCAWALVASLA
jgi:hypothetical protein